jgi:hypothetical protein
MVTLQDSGVRKESIEGAKPQPLPIQHVKDEVPFNLVISFTKINLKKVFWIEF